MLLALLLLLVPLLPAQQIEGPTFEVASIKAAKEDYVFGELSGGPGSATPTRAKLHASIAPLVRAAFGLSEREYVNLDKLPSTKFDFEAVLPEGSTKDHYRAMLRNFLMERFHMRYHLETREISVYELRIASGGHKLKLTANEPPEEGKPPFTRTPDGYLTFPKGTNTSFSGNGPRFSVQRVHTTMDEFAEALDKEWLHAPVVNLTELTGQYDFYLRFDARRETPDNKEPLDPPLEPSLQSQLGLSLKQGKQPREVVVIDAFDQEPTAN